MSYWDFPCFHDPPPLRGPTYPVPGSNFPRPPRAVAACSVFLSTIVPIGAVPCITRRQSSLWCRRHSRQHRLRGPCSGGQMERGTRAGTIDFSGRLGVRALIKTYGVRVHGESWTIYVKSLHKCWPYLPSFRKVVPGQFYPIGLGFSFCTYVRHL